MGSLTRKRETFVWPILLSLAVMGPGSAAEGDRPQLRGPRADGLADDQPLPVRWTRTENVAWSATLPGWGTSSPVVWGDRVFVTSQTEKNGKRTLWTLAFDRRSGKELWRHDFGFGYDQKTHEKSTLAVNTPLATADAVIVSFGNAETACYSHDGKLLWLKRLVPELGKPLTAWGFAASPVIHGDEVLVPYDHHQKPCYLVGLDRKTGAVVWKEERPIGTNYSTPLIVTHHGQTDVLVSGKNRLTAFDAATHRERWRYGEGMGPYNGEIIVSPVYGEGLVFCQLWRQSPIHALRLQPDGKPPKQVWVSSKPGPQEPSLLCYRGHLYALLDNCVLVCYEARTGEELYRERVGSGDCNSSPVAADGKIYVSNNLGKTYVLQAGKKFRILEVNDLEERITASPAISAGQLIYRTDSHLYCLGSRKDK